MCVIYLLSRSVEAQKDHGRLVLRNEAGKKTASVPFKSIGSLVVSKEAHLTMPLLYELINLQVPVLFVDWRGHVLDVLGAGQMRLEYLFHQQTVLNNSDCQLRLIRELVKGKICRQRSLLREFSYKKGEMVLKDALARLKYYERRIMQLSQPEELRGLEGLAARTYFSTFSVLLDESLWPWPGRQQHPAHEPVNALLNYGYAFLEKEIRIAIAGAGLDCRIGFFHTNNGRKDSLVYDLMEPFRQTIIDRFVLKLLNYGTFKPTDFEEDKENGCRLVAAGHKQWIEHYEAYMEKEVRAYEGLTPRTWIRSQIQNFAKEVFSKGEEMADDEISNRV